MHDLRNMLRGRQKQPKVAATKAEHVLLHALAKVNGCFNQANPHLYSQGEISAEQSLLLTNSRGSYKVSIISLNATFSSFISETL